MPTRPAYISEHQISARAQSRPGVHAAHQPVKPSAVLDNMPPMAFGTPRCSPLHQVLCGPLGKTSPFEAGCYYPGPSTVSFTHKQNVVGTMPCLSPEHTGLDGGEQWARGMFGPPAFLRTVAYCATGRAPAKPPPQHPSLIQAAFAAYPTAALTGRTQSYCAAEALLALNAVAGPTQAVSGGCRAATTPVSVRSSTPPPTTPEAAAMTAAPAPPSKATPTATRLEPIEHPIEAAAKAPIKFLATPTSFKSKAGRTLRCGYGSCGKTFATSGNQKRHVKEVHFKERRFVCGFAGCAKSFQQKSHLTTHLMKHTGEKPHGCDVCGQDFRQKVHLDGHFASERHRQTVKQAAAMRKLLHRSSSSSDKRERRRSSFSKPQP